MDSEFNPSFLESLTGRTLRINKGGPESKIGRLLAVHEDYLVLLVDEMVIYYNLNHIKSVTEDSKNVSTFNPNDTGSNAFNFHGLLESLEGKTVRIDRGGPESRVGTLLAVHDDYLALSTEKDGTVYYQIHHIKSVSVEQTPSAAMTDTSEKYVNADSFADLLNDLKYSWVKVNRGGPESVEGVLTGVSEDFITLVANGEVFRIVIFHVRSISLSQKMTRKMRRALMGRTRTKGNPKREAAKKIAEPVAVQKVAVQKVAVQEVAEPAVVREAAEPVVVREAAHVASTSETPAPEASRCSVPAPPQDVVAEEVNPLLGH